jgi:hypothetical protein
VDAAEPQLRVHTTHAAAYTIHLRQSHHASQRTGTQDMRYCGEHALY